MYILEGITVSREQVVMTLKPEYGKRQIRVKLRVDEAHDLVDSLQEQLQAQYEERLEK